MNQIFAWLISIVFIASLILLLWFVVRFSLISDHRTRNCSNRLRHPEIDEVCKEWNIPIPPELDAWYRETDWVERSEFYLLDSGQKNWYVYQCIPLTVRDQSEWIKITGVPGLPVAIGGTDDKSTYYLPFESLKSKGPVPVMMRQTLQPLNLKVADSIEDFARFQYNEFSDESQRNGLEFISAP